MKLKPIKELKIEVGKEYEVQQRFAVVEQVCGSTVVCRDRWDQVFECDIGYVKEKHIPKKSKTLRKS